MLAVESQSHQKALMEGLNQLRLEGTLTDLTLYSKEGDCFSIHSIILTALGITNLVPLINPRPTEARLDVSTAVLKILISYLYRGVLDLQDADLRADESILDNIATASNQYDINSLRQLINCYRKLDLTVKEANRHACLTFADVVQPCSRTAQQKGLQAPHELKTTSADKLETSEVQDEERTIAVSNSQYQGEKTHVATKQVLKRFLDTKAQDEMAKRNSKQSLEQKLPDQQSHQILCCHVCGKVITKKGFPAHMKVHKNIKDMTCEVCGKRFRKACNLTEHWQRMHSLSKAYTCSRCGSSFAIKSDLTRHVARHKKTCFVCELCGASFVGKVMWKKHKCMGDIFITDDLGSVFVEDPTSTVKSLNHKSEQMEEDILNISTLLPLDFTDNTGSREILSEIDGLFYENRRQSQPSQFAQ